MKSSLLDKIPLEKQFSHPLAEIDVKNNRLNDWCLASMLVNLIMNPYQSQDNAETAIQSAVKFIKIANPLIETQPIIENIRRRSLKSCLEAVNLIQEGIHKATTQSNLELK